MIASIFLTASTVTSVGRHVDLDRRHQRLVELQVDAVHLALARRELAVGREHARDVRLVVLVVGRVVELDEIAVWSVAVFGCSACSTCSGRSRSARSTTRPSAPFFLNTNSASACSSYSCMPGRASRIASMMPSPAMRVASRMTAISRGLFTARSALTIGSRSLISTSGAAAFSFAMNVCFARVAAVPRIALVGGPQPRRVALRLAAEHFGGERRVDGAVVVRERGRSPR